MFIKGLSNDLLEEERGEMVRSPGHFSSRHLLPFNPPVPLSLELGNRVPMRLRKFLRGIFFFSPLFFCFLFMLFKMRFFYICSLFLSVSCNCFLFLLRIMNIIGIVIAIIIPTKTLV